MRAVVIALFFLAFVAVQCKPLTGLIPLNGGSQRPPVDSPFSAVATFTLDSETLQFWTHISHNIPNVVAAHIHAVSVFPLVENNGPVVLPFINGGNAAGNTTVGTGKPIPAGVIYHSSTLTPTLACQILSGSAYYNLHTPANPSGEVRGNVPSMIGSGTCADFLASVNPKPATPAPVMASAPSNVNLNFGGLLGQN
eukprot:TRINITY_DN9786_c0_g1_i1.p1 TRINITY_DN9786_c0_g1~~TRINITY_DN9786_c0_g1_i1.p1  ORF type:complete len:208 (+),score=72.68 TRINITY_DN9786_c0_g1_i1:37-624(+)